MVQAHHKARCIGYCNCSLICIDLVVLMVLIAPVLYEPHENMMKVIGMNFVD